jgi:hypothetical protein
MAGNSDMPLQFVYLQMELNFSGHNIMGYIQTSIGIIFYLKWHYDDIDMQRY